jgi:sugar lactone lactonase YvrE
MKFTPNPRSFHACLLALACASFASAQQPPFRLGDVFAAVAKGRIQHYDSTARLLETLTNGLSGANAVTGMAFDNAGDLYATNFDKSSVSRYSGPDAPHTHSIFLRTDNSGQVESILVDSTGNFYVGQAGGTKDVLKFGASGNLLERFDVQTELRGSDWIDLAADGRTLFYTSEGKRVLRYDLTTKKQLPAFNLIPFPATAFDIRLLPDRGLLVADSLTVLRLDANGRVVQTYDAPRENAWFALALDPDSRSFWCANSATANFYKFDLATGAILKGPINTGTGANSLRGLAVFGERRGCLSCLPPIANNPAPVRLEFNIPPFGAIICADSVSVRASFAWPLCNVPPCTIQCSINGVRATIVDTSASATIPCPDGPLDIIAVTTITNALGNSTTSRDTLTITCAAPPMCEIEITSPSDSAIFCGDSMLVVQGSWRAHNGKPPYQVGCTINGVAARISDSTFFAAVPFRPGENVFVAAFTVVDSCGARAFCRDSIRVFCPDSLLTCFLGVSSPRDSAMFCSDSVTISGELVILGGVPPYNVTCQANGVTIASSENTFRGRLPCRPDYNTFEIICAITDSTNARAVCRDAVTVFSDITSPECSLNFGTLPVITGEAVDLESGIASIEVVVAINRTVTIEPFVPGARTVRFRSEKIDTTQRSTFTLRITNRAGCETLCDPVDLNLAAAAEGCSASFSLPATDRYLLVNNNGLQRIDLNLNRTALALEAHATRRDHQGTTYFMPFFGKRTIDLLAFLSIGDNEVTLRCAGAQNTGARLLFLDHDPSALAGGTKTFSALPMPKILAIAPDASRSFNTGMKLIFEVPQGWSKAFQVRVYNANGETLHTLFRGRAAPGRHSLVWNGSDRSGRAVANGLYLFQISSGNVAVLKKAMLAR